MDANKKIDQERPVKPPLDILIIDNEEIFTEACSQTLERGGYRTAVANNGPLGIQMAGSAHPGVVLLDLKISGLPGLELLGLLVKAEPTAVPIVVTGHGTVDSAVESMKTRSLRFSDQTHRA